MRLSATHGAQAPITFSQAQTSALPDEPKQKTGYSQDREHDEKNLSNFHGAGGNTTEAEQGGDQCNNKEYNGIVQHDRTPDGTSGKPVGLKPSQPISLR